MQNLRVDIIYYNMPSDFEMEFNLDGACRMRKLTDMVTDRKSYVLSLSRAVTRSRIIIASGPLFGDKGLIYVTAKAVGRGFSRVNNAEYGITEEDDIDIIEGSMPLVTSGGIFGGLIMESGPQTIILLSENKSIRKNITINLIHPYLEQISMMPVTDGEETDADELDAQAEELMTGEEQPAETEETEEVEETASEQEDIDLIDESADFEEKSEETEETETAEEDETVEDEIVEDEIVEDENDAFVFEPQNVKANKRINPYEIDYTSSEEDNQYLTDDSGKSSKNKLGFPIIFFSVLLLLCIALIFVFTVVLPYKNGLSTAEYIKTILGLKAFLPKL